MRHTKYAFTLVEILIVVALLGILAAIVLPTLQGHIQQARETAAKDNLHILRNTIELYAAQHRGVPPGYPNGNQDADPFVIAFVWQLTKATDSSHQTANPGTEGYPYGPYINKFPTNPLNDESSVTMILNSGEFPEEPTGTYGWIYKAATKTIKLDWPGTDSKGIDYYDY